MGAKPPKPTAILAALAFALSAFGLTLFVWISFGGPVPLQAQKYRIHILLGPEAAQLTRGSQVRIAGVKVGKVVAFETKGINIDAEVEIDRPFTPVASNARAILRNKSLLGETFIELAPGDRNAKKLSDGGTLAKGNVQSAQPIDQVLASFDEKTRQNFKEFLQGISKALENRGPDLNAALGNLGPGAEDVGQLMTVLDRQRPAVRSLIRDSGAVLESIGNRESDLRDLIRAGDAVFTATASRNAELTETVRRFPPFLRELRTTLVGLEGTAEIAGPTLRVLRPVAPLLRPALEATAETAPDIKGLFEELGPVITAAQKGVPAADRIVRATTPLVRRLDPAARQLVPVTRFTEAKRDDLVGGLSNTAASLQDTYRTSDGRTEHILRVIIPIWNEGLMGWSQRLASNRHNPYMAPGGYANWTNLPAFDCKNTGNPQTLPAIGSGPPLPCLEQAPWSYDGKTPKTSFPQLRAYEP